MSYTPITNFNTTLAQSMTDSQLTMVLSSVTVQGHAIVTADYGGSVIYFTINPGASNMEVIKCTSNSGTTFTIHATGRGLSWYGETTAQQSGYAFNHNAGEPVIVSNNKDVYGELVDKYTDETIAGIKTFTSSPVVPTPSSNTDAANKAYADSLTYSGTPDANTTTKGTVEEATQAEVDARTVTGGTSAKLFAPLDKIRASQYHDYAVDSVGTDSYAITVTPAITAYAAGQVFIFKAGTANTGAATLAVSGLASPKAIQKNGSALVTGDILANNVVMVVYDGTQFQLIGAAPSAETLLGANADATTANFNEAMTFFANTDITGAEAQTLTGGGDATTAHYHQAFEDLKTQLNNNVKMVVGNKVDGLTAVANGTGTVTRNFSDTVLFVTAASDDAGLGDGGNGFYSTTPSAYITWGDSPNLRATASMKFSATDTTSFFFGFYYGGLSAAPTNATDTGRHVAFMVNTADDKLYASVGDGTTQNKTDVSTGITMTAFNLFEIVFTGGTSAVFKVNGTTVATLSTNLPATSGNVSFQTILTGTGADDRQVIIRHPFGFGLTNIT